MGGIETAVLRVVLFGGANGAGRIDGLPVDVERADGVSSTKF